MAKGDFITGARYLARLRSGASNDITEFTVIEISPSGERMKVRYSPGANIVWVEIDSYCLLEKLPTERSAAEYGIAAMRM